MKKQIALLLSTVMCVGSFYVPVFAGQEGRLSNESSPKAKTPITIETELNESVFDHRSDYFKDITITENKLGAFEEGKTISIKIDDMKFDEDVNVEVSEGDVEIESAKVEDGILIIKIGSESKKQLSTIVISRPEVIIPRKLPIGFYSILLVAGKNDLIFQDKYGLADVDGIILNDEYVEIVSQDGRDDDLISYTVEIIVTVGEKRLIRDGDVVCMDQPAYISEGYVMLPVRAVTEALSGAAIVRWDDATKTVTITFGARVVSMTVGSETMNINGVPVQMSKACEITDSRSFIPLRDLGYALGLNDSKINWDDVTKTATLN